MDGRWMVDDLLVHDGDPYAAPELEDQERRRQQIAVTVRWVSDGFQVNVRWVSDVGVRWAPDGRHRVIRVGPGLWLWLGLGSGLGSGLRGVKGAN